MIRIAEVLGSINAELAGLETRRKRQRLRVSSVSSARIAIVGLLTESPAVVSIENSIPSIRTFPPKKSNKAPRGVADVD